MSSDPASSPVRITRRTVVLGLGAMALAGSGTAAYGIGIEPMRLAITHYRITPMAPWPAGLSLRIVAVSDVHACDPFMTPAHIRRIVEAANGLGGDVIVLLGDYVSGMDRLASIVDSADWAPVLGALKAPLGTYAILGNHDWWADRAACERGHGPTFAGEALTRAGIRVLENEALPLRKGGTRGLARRARRSTELRAHVVALRSPPEGKRRPAGHPRRHPRWRALHPPRPRAGHLPAGARPCGPHSLGPYPWRTGPVPWLRTCRSLPLWASLCLWPCARAD